MTDPLTGATARFLQAISPLSDEQMSMTSRLPNWTRGHVATHVARNADAMANLCTWATSGVQLPMYRSREERDLHIEQGSTRSASEIVADVRQSAVALESAIASLTDQALKTKIRMGAGALGPEIPASKIAWMRLREVEIHLVDLDLSPTFSDTPIEFLNTLLADEISHFENKMEGITLKSNEGERFKIGNGAQAISGSLADLTAWLLGRATDSELARLESPSPILAPPKWL